MEKQRPMSDAEFLLINGVGRKKMEDYGYRFIKEIIAFSKDKREKKPKTKRSKKSNTFKETLELYDRGLSIEEMAKEKGVSTNTIYAHLIKLYDQEEEINLHQFVPKSDLKAIKKAKSDLNDPNSLKAYFEHFEAAIPYETIKLGLKIIADK